MIDMSKYGIRCRDSAIMPANIGAHAEAIEDAKEFITISIVKAILSDKNLFFTRHADQLGTFVEVGVDLIIMSHDQYREAIIDAKKDLGRG